MKNNKKETTQAEKIKNNVLRQELETKSLELVKNYDDNRNQLRKLKGVEDIRKCVTPKGVDYTKLSLEAQSLITSYPKLSEKEREIRETEISKQASDITSYFFKALLEKNFIIDIHNDKNFKTTQDVLEDVLFETQKYAISLNYTLDTAELVLKYMDLFKAKLEAMKNEITNIAYKSYYGVYGNSHNDIGYLEYEKLGNILRDIDITKLEK